MKIKNSSLHHISNQINSLNLEQLDTLFQAYEQLNIQFSFFMSPETYQNFLNIYYQTSNKHQPNTFKSLINLLITYTYPQKYSHTLLTINLIKKNYTLHSIINTVYLHR